MHTDKQTDEQEKGLAAKFLSSKQHQLYRLSWVVGNTLHPYDSLLSSA